MTQATASAPAVEKGTCSTCPHFDNFHEKNDRGWCQLFNHQAREHHEITNDCINSSDLVVSQELKDNAECAEALFTNINHEELQAFPPEEIEEEIDKPYSPYQVGSVVKIIDAEEHYTEWAVFEVVECRYNKYIHNPHNPEAYITHVEWFYRLCSQNDSCALDKSLWVAQNEICDFDMSHNVCTEEIF